MKSILLTIFAISLFAIGNSAAFAGGHSCDGSCKGDSACTCKKCTCEKGKECSCDHSCSGGTCTEGNH